MKRARSIARLLFFSLTFVAYQNVQRCLTFRKYDSLDLDPASGVYQTNQYGHPIKIVDHDQGHIWSIPDTPEGLNAHANASPINNPTAILPAYGGTNLNYGTTTTVGGKKLEAAPPALPKVPSGPPPAPEVVENVNGQVVTVPAERVAKMYEPPKAAPPTPQPGAYTPQVQSAVPPQPMMAVPPSPPTIFSPDPTNPMPNPAGEMSALGSVMGTLLGGFNMNVNANSNLPGMPTIPTIGVPNFSSLFKTLAKRSAIDKQIMDKAPVKDPICTRDYSKKCPAGWEPLDNFHCRAHLDYSGACPHMLKTEPMNAQEKSKVALECKVHWPCMNDPCEQLEGVNWEAPCPEKWVLTEECEAPEDYQGHCNTRQNLSGLSISQKEQFASACQVTWPCKKRACERDYGKLCPEGWKYNAETDTCEAPEGYTGSSFVTPVGMSQMTTMGRKAVEAEYGALWPCKTVAAECVADYAHFPCPEGWENVMQSNACLAPEGFDEKPGCPQLTHFDFFTEEEKAAFASRCDVHWPCAGSVEKDYGSCPQGWKEITEDGPYKGWCEPTVNYHGLCNEKMDIKSMPQGQKETFAMMCELEFLPVSKAKKIYKPSKLLEGTAVSYAPTVE